MVNIVKLGEVKPQSEAGPAPDQQQTAEHVASVSFELSEMAAMAEMPFLKYLLDMTIEEATQQGQMSRRRRTDTH
jgi:hypothetical protein